MLVKKNDMASRQALAAALDLNSDPLVVAIGSGETILKASVVVTTPLMTISIQTGVESPLVGRS